MLSVTGGSDDGSLEIDPSFLLQTWFSKTVTNKNTPIFSGQQSQHVIYNIPR